MSVKESNVRSVQPGQALSRHRKSTSSKFQVAGRRCTWPSTSGLRMSGANLFRNVLAASLRGCFVNVRLFNGVPHAACNVTTGCFDR
jgi:hypothetical protein